MVHSLMITTTVECDKVRVGPSSNDLYWRILLPVIVIYCIAISVTYVGLNYTTNAIIIIVGSVIVF